MKLRPATSDSLLPKPNVLDRVIGWVDPVRAQSRMAARYRMNLSRAYLAAAPGDSWRPRRATASANADHQADAATLRAKSRFLIQNVEYITAGMDWRVAHIVGTGIVRKWGGRDGERLKALHQRWSTECDADGRCDLAGLESLAVRAMEADGEVLVRLRPRRPSDGLAVPLQLQVLEVDWLDTTRQTADNGNLVIEGKEYDSRGRCVAYWLWNQHPGDMGLRASRKGITSSRVAAEYITHLYDIQRPGQGRGFPRLAAVIPRTRDLQLLEDAELQRKNLEGRLSVLASANAAMIENPNADLTRGSIGDLASGGITNVGGGMDLTVVQPQAMPGFVEYCRHNIHLICAGAGFTYEAATGDLSDTNFSSGRIGQMNAKRSIERLQWLTVIPGLCQAIDRAFVRAAALSGALPEGRAPEYTVEYSTPRWEMVNPQQEISAKRDQLAAGLTSFSETYRQDGENPEVRIPELAKDIARFKELGIWEDVLAMTLGSRQQPTQPGPDPKPSAGKAATKPATT